MTESLQFQTRARTIDHLGREQIADCPTAISELWKNSYDAYARSASLQIFDGEPVVAALYDDGHGMSRLEFVDKWLVVGTESKVGSSITPKEDRNGLAIRNRQGKKGIGRLSAAYVGNLLLLISKRRNHDFVAALVDWRIFENPFLILDDVRIPLITFREKEDLFKELPNLYDTLMSNVWGDSTNEERKKRILSAWKTFDELEAKAGKGAENTTRSQLEKTLIRDAFTTRHVAEWEVWSGKSDHGTAMLITGVIPDVEVQLYPNSLSATDGRARLIFKSTLWSFVDPFRGLAEGTEENSIVDFDTSVLGWRGDRRMPIIENAAGFRSQAAEHLEHVIDGRVDETGTFRGRVKVFGEWLSEPAVIRFEEAMPNRVDSVVGPFAFYAAAMEFEPKNTTLSNEEFSQLSELLSQFSGLMVFRDGFRVMPYGRIDSDYFEIEERRSKNAGREFWNHRRMLGRIAISYEANPNLKDKAGREGIIDNRASKTFRALVVNILQTSARLYFGSASEMRKEKLPELHEAYSAKQKEVERERMLKQKRRQFRSRLQENYPLVEEFARTVQAFRLSAQHLVNNGDENEGIRLQQELSLLKQKQGTLKLGSAPSALAPKLQQMYANHRRLLQESSDTIRETESLINEALERLNPISPQELVKSEVERQTKHVHKRLSKWISSIQNLLESERKRVVAHGKSRMELLRDTLAPVPSDVESGRIKLTNGLSLVEETAKTHDSENERQLEPLIAALESLSENINLDLLAGDSSEEVSGLRAELDRLTALAQLGITVEIIDHELASFNATIAHGLKRFPGDVRESRPYKQVLAAYEGLSSRLSFLSPLKLSGDAEYRHISGADIEEYAKEFFTADLGKGTFRIYATDEFLKFSVYEQPARIYPVFINLINNSRYWLHQRDSDDRRVLLSVREGKVLVSDNGPGINAQDLPDLFRIFFTRRQGGRGVGLYLCRSNLTAGGHKISYLSDVEGLPLDGANFSIEFRDASFPS